MSRGTGNLRQKSGTDLISARKGRSERPVSHQTVDSATVACRPPLNRRSCTVALSVGGKTDFTR